MVTMSPVAAVSEVGNHSYGAPLPPTSSGDVQVHVASA